MFRRFLCLAVLSAFSLGLNAAHSCAQDPPRRVITRVAPEYPALASSMRLRGTVRIDALVTADGTPKSVEVRGGHPVLALAAQKAVRQWRWEPAPHETHELIEIKFSPKE